LRLLWFERSATSPTWNTWKSRLKNSEDWVSRNIDFDEALHWCEHHWRRLALAAAVLLIAGYVASG